LNSYLLAICALIYGFVSIQYFMDSRIGMGFAFLFYAGANLGFIRDALTGGR